MLLTTVNLTSIWYCVTVLTISPAGMAATGIMRSERPVSLKAFPQCTLMDETVSIEVGGLMSKQAITLRSYLDDEGKQFESHAHYTSKEDGSLNATNQPSEGGLFTGVEPMGLFWSMVACPKHKFGTRYMKRDVTSPLVITITVHNGHLDANQLREDDSPMAATSVERWYMSKDVEKIKVHTGKIRGSLLKPKGNGPYPAVVDMFGGVRPGCNEIRAALLASRGYVAFALAYFGEEGQPAWLDEAEVLEMEYFEEAVDWLCSQPFVQPGGVGTIGVCKGGEMALAMAIHLPTKIRATVAISTSGVFNVCPTTYKGQTFPCAGLADDQSWEEVARLMAKTSDGAIITRDVAFAVKTEFQTFEDIRCPALIICGEKDASVHNNHGRKIAEKIQTNGHANRCELIIYPGAGHLIEPPHAPLCITSFQPPWGLIEWGGIPADHAHAQVDAWAKLLAFLRYNMVDNQSMPSSRL